MISPAGAGDGTVQAVPIELVLLRQAAEYLAQAVFLTDSEGGVLFYNQAAEALLGRPFAQVERQGLADWLDGLGLVDEAGHPVQSDAAPSAVARREGRPAHAVLGVRGLDGVTRRLAATAVPLVGQGGDLVGTMSLLWEADGGGGAP